MKKILWVVGGLFFALLVAIISVPLFVDVDQYRTQITAEVNKRINGELSLGKLKLTLWGAINIHAESIVVKVNGFTDPLVDTKQFHLRIPYLSLLSGRPQVIAVLDAPKILVTTNEAGKMNVLEFLAPAPGTMVTPPSTPPADVASSTPAPVSTEPSKVPALLAGSSLGLDITKGELHYVDKAAKSEYHVNGLDLEAENLGLGSTMQIRVTAPLKGSTPTLTFEGPVQAAAELTPVLVNRTVKSVKGSMDIDATNLAIALKSGSFKKSNGQAMQLKAVFDGDEQQTLLRSLEMRLHDFKVHGKGRLTLAPVTAKLEINTDPLKLESLAELVPMLATYQLKGTANLNLQVDKDAAALRATGDAKVSDGSFFLKGVLQAPMQFQLQAGFSETTLNIVRASLSGPDTELQATGNVRNFLAPQFNLALTGKSFNVDKTLVLPTAGAEAKSAQVLDLFLPPAHAAKPDVNPMAALAENPIVAKANGVLTAQIGRVTVYDANLERVQARATLQNLSLKLADASFRTFGGVVKGSGDFQLRSPNLPFSTKGSVEDIMAKDAFGAYFPKFRNTLEGVVDSSWNVSGSLYPSTARLRSLKGTAKVFAENGVLKSVDFQQKINEAMQKIPFLKNKKPLVIDDGFKTLTADIRFDGGVIRVEPIDMQPREKGFVVKGKSTIQESLEQESFFDVFDPQGRLPREIQQQGKPALAFRLYGPVSAPKADYEYTVTRLASSAGKNALKDAAGKALEKVLGGEGQDGNQDKLKSLGDKLRQKFKF